MRVDWTGQGENLMTWNGGNRMDKRMNRCHAHLKWMEVDVKMDVEINSESLKIRTEVLAMIAELEDFKGAWAKWKDSHPVDYQSGPLRRRS